MVEVRARPRCEQLQDTVGTVDDEPDGERGDGLPVEGDGATRQVGNACGEEEEVQDELHHALPPLVERLLRLDVEEADQVDHQQCGEDCEHRHGRAREAGTSPFEGEGDQEHDREDVGEPDRARDVPLHLLPGDAQECGQEERAGDLQASPLSTSASSSTRADRPSRSRSAGDSGVPSSAPACHFACSSDRAAVKAGTSSGRRHDPGSGLTDEIRRGAVGRHSGQDRALGREVLENLPRQHSAPTSARFGDQQEESIGIALERERLAARHVRMQLEPVPEPERLRPLPIGDAEVTDEAGDDVLEAGLCECGQERPRIALPEEAARVRDPKAVAAVVLQPGEVVEVGAVEDRRHGSGRFERRASSAIASDAATMTSAWRATSRATDALTFSLARTDARSTRRCG